ncbi:MULTISPECIES: hypothetical protein [Moorena]|uniref:hypothetical protein n=1 Tax=Moorena TaxID=1155738 RepID=UPI00030634DD|nr:MULTISPECIES: hypothetical protein [Moorena]NEP30018.1 hypothetical protein [Moorena sp. SIO3B2]NEP65479.1 hypothetical protein [Moorena sp. SIO3A5]NEQ07539.1 hypothetical protein [Moorena sp. SIO4E2]NER85654.1 hypothetical protein [Moorena sp. SIO3A2]NET64628.1 hypothetical protein [Moorena sp. SIO1G6]
MKRFIKISYKNKLQYNIYLNNYTHFPISLSPYFLLPAPYFPIPDSRLPTPDSPTYHKFPLILLRLDE